MIQSPKKSKFVKEVVKPKENVEPTPLFVELPGSVKFNLPQRAVLGVVQTATDLVMDREGAIMIA